MARGMERTSRPTGRVEPWPGSAVESRKKCPLLPHAQGFFLWSPDRSQQGQGPERDI